MKYIYIIGFCMFIGSSTTAQETLLELNDFGDLNNSTLLDALEQYNFQPHIRFENSFTPGYMSGTNTDNYPSFSDPTIDLPDRMPSLTTPVFPNIESDGTYVDEGRTDLTFSGENTTTDTTPTSSVDPNIVIESSNVNEGLKDPSFNVDYTTIDATNSLAAAQKTGNQQVFGLDHKTIQRYSLSPLSFQTLEVSQTEFSKIFERLEPGSPEASWLMNSFLFQIENDPVGELDTAYLDEVLQFGVENGDINSALELYSEIDPETRNILYNSFVAMGTPEASARAAEIGLELGKISQEEALSVYLAEKNVSPFAGVRAAEFSLLNPDFPNVVTPQEAFDLLAAASNANEFQATVALTRVFNATLPPELARIDGQDLYIGTVGKAKNAIERNLIIDSSTFQCQINNDPRNCPALPIFYVTDRAQIDVGETLSYDDKPAEDATKVFMGQMEHRVDANRFVDGSALNTAWSLQCLLDCNEIAEVNIGRPRIGSDVDNDAEVFAARVKAFAELHGHDRLVLFFHGYNNSFDDASLRLTHLMTKAEYPAIPVLFSFASRASEAEYRNDQKTITQSCVKFRPVVEALVAEFPSGVTFVDSEGSKVDVIAHSLGAELFFQMAMGCRESGVTNIAPWGSRLFRNVIFAAGDISTNKFKNGLERFRAITDELTLYMSRRDSALLLSNGVNTIWCKTLEPCQNGYEGGPDDRRLGVGGDVRFLSPDVTVIDATSIEGHPSSGRVDHDYVFSVPPTRRDLTIMLNGYLEDTVVRCIIPDISEEFFHIQPDCNL